jgi:C-terminal processing protease CtpA/Prc
MTTVDTWHLITSVLGLAVTFIAMSVSALRWLSLTLRELINKQGDELRDLSERQTNDVKSIYERMAKTNKDIYDKLETTNKDIIHRLDDMLRTMHQMQIDMYKSYVRKEDMELVQKNILASTEKQMRDLGVQLAATNTDIAKTNERIEKIYNHGCYKLLECQTLVKRLEADSGKRA